MLVYFNCFSTLFLLPKTSSFPEVERLQTPIHFFFFFFLRPKKVVDTIFTFCCFPTSVSTGGHGDLHQPCR